LVYIGDNESNGIGMIQGLETHQGGAMVDSNACPTLSKVESMTGMEGMEGR
jgi:hypothetical protein